MQLERLRCIVAASSAVYPWCVALSRWVRAEQSWFDPAHVRVRSYAVTVEGEQLGAADAALETSVEPGPYVAETYPVAVERQYLVVDLPA